MNRLLGIAAISWIGGILGLGISYAGYVLAGKSLAIVSVLTLVVCVFLYVRLFIIKYRGKFEK